MHSQEVPRFQLALNFANKNLPSYLLRTFKTNSMNIQWICSFILYLLGYNTYEYINEGYLLSATGEIVNISC